MALNDRFLAKGASAFSVEFVFALRALSGTHTMTTRASAMTVATVAMTVKRDAVIIQRVRPGVSCVRFQHSHFIFFFFFLFAAELALDTMR